MWDRICELRYIPVAMDVMFIPAHVHGDLTLQGTEVLELPVWDCEYDLVPCGQKSQLCILHR